MRSTAAITLAVQLLAGGAASAQPQDATSQDLTCMVVTMMFASQTTDPAMQQGATGGMAYYMGKLKGRDPNLDLKARFVAEANALVANPVRLKAEASRCGADMQTWGAETKEIGEALKAESRKLQGKPAT